MTKLELKIPQPGVTFYGNRRLTTVTILDIKVDDGVKEVFFEGLKDCDVIEVLRFKVIAAVPMLKGCISARMYEI